MTDVQVRNTVAVTGLTSGFAENVLPPGASVRFNSRLLPGATAEDVIAYLKEAAGRWAGAGGGGVPGGAVGRTSRRPRGSVQGKGEEGRVIRDRPRRPQECGSGAQAEAWGCRAS